MSENDGIENPIYIETLQHHRDHSHIATNGDAHHRFPIRPEEIWNEYSTIPDVPPPGLIADGAVVGDLTMFKSKALTQVVGTTQKFELATPGDLARVVPATFGQVAPVSGSVAPTLTGSPATGYTPVIVDSTGGVFPQQASSWVVDGLNNYVEFPYGVPSTMVAPFSLTFIKYTGLVGGGCGAPAVPNVIDLWVAASPTGNDATGHGTMVAPYLTIERALHDIRQSGWNDTATITILSSAGTYTFPSGSVSFNAGGCGAQRTPLRIKGDTVTTVGSHVVDAATLANASSGLLELHATAAFAVAPGSLGNRIHFTSGAMSTLTKGGAFANTVQAQLPIASVLAADTVILPFDATTTIPGAGDTFDVETLDTRVALSGVMVIQPNSGPVIFEDFNLDVTSVGGQGGIVAENTLIATYGINITTVAAGVDLVLENVEGGWLAGLCDDDLVDGYELTTKSLFIDTTQVGARLIKLSNLDNMPRQWGNMVLLADPAGATTNTVELSGSVSASYWESAGQITAPANGGKLKLTALHARLSRTTAAIAAHAGGEIIGTYIFIDDPLSSGILADNYGTVSIVGTTGATITDTFNGIFANNGGIVSVDAPSTITGFASAGIRLESGAHLSWSDSASSVTFSGGFAGLQVYSGSSAVFGTTVILTVSGNSWGIALDQQGSVTAREVIATGNTLEGIILERQSKLAVRLTLDASSSNTGGGGAGNIKVDSGSNLNVGTNLTASTAANGDNLYINGASTVYVGGALTATGSATRANIFMLYHSKLTVVGVADLKSATRGAIEAESACDIAFLSTLDASLAGATAISIINKSKMFVSGPSLVNDAGQLTSGNGLFVLDESEIRFDATLSVANSTLVNINAVDRSVVSVGSGLTATNASAAGAIITGKSSLFAESFADLSGAGTNRGLRLTGGSFAHVAGNLIASTDAATGLEGVNLSESELRVEGLLTATGCGGSGNIRLTAGSKMVVNSITATGARLGNCITMSGASQLITLSGAATLTGSVAGSGLVMSEGSTAQLAGTLDASTSGGGPGISLTQSSIASSAAITATGNASDNILLNNNSTMFVGDTLTATGSAGGDNIKIQNSSKFIAVGAADLKSANGNAVDASNRSTVIFLSTIDGSLAGSSGIFMINSCNMFVAGAAIVNDASQVTAFGSGVSLLDDCKIRFDSTLSVTGAVINNINILDRSTISVGSTLTATAGGINGALVDDGSIIHVEGAADLSGAVTGFGVRLLRGADATFLNTLTAAGSGASNLGMESNSTIYVGGVADLSNATVSGLVMSNNSVAIFSDTLNTSDFAGGTVSGSGISVTSSKLSVVGTVTANVGQQGIFATNCAMLCFTSGVNTTLNTTTGLNIADRSTLFVGGATFASSNSTDNIVVTGGSTAQFDGTLTASTAGSGSGILATNCSTLCAGDTVTATGNVSDNITLETGTKMIVNGALTATGSTAGSGLSISGSSVLYAGAAATLTGNKISGLVETTSANVHIVGTLDVSDLAVASTGPGMDISSSKLTVDGAVTAVGAAAAGGIATNNCSTVCFGSTVTATGNAGVGIRLEHTEAKFTDAIDTSTNASGLILISSNLIAAAITSSSNTGFGISILNSSNVYASGAVIASGNTSININTIHNSSLFANSTITANTGVAGITSESGSSVTIIGALTATGNSSFGILVNVCASFCANTVTVTGSGGDNVFVASSSRLLLASGPGAKDLIASGGGANGLTVSSNSEVFIEGKADLFDATTSGLVITGQSRVLINGALDTSNTAAAVASHGISVTRSELTVVGAVDSNDVGGSGIAIINCATLCFGGATNANGNGVDGVSIERGSSLQVDDALTATGNTATGVKMALDSTLRVQGITTVTGNATNGLSALEHCFINCFLAIIASGTTAGNGITITSSHISTTLGVTASDCSGNGIAAAVQSTISGFFLGSIIANDNGTNNILISDESSLVMANGGITATGAGTNGIHVEDHSNLHVDGNVDVTDATISGLALASSSVVNINGTLDASDVTGGTVTGPGISVAQSKLAIGGAVSSNAGDVHGIIMSKCSTLCAGSTISTVGCGDDGINISEASTFNASGRVTSNSNAGTGMVVDRGSKAVLIGLTAGSNTGNGIDILRGSKVCCSGTMLSGAANGAGTVGVSIRTGSKLQNDGAGIPSTNTISGPLGDVMVGTNGGVPWTSGATAYPGNSIDDQDSGVNTDFVTTAGIGGSELCMVAYSA